MQLSIRWNIKLKFCEICKPLDRSMLRARAKGSSDHSCRYGNLEYTVSVRTLWVAWYPKNSASSFFCKISDISKVIYPLQKKIFFIIPNWTQHKSWEKFKRLLLLVQVPILWNPQDCNTANQGTEELVTIVADMGICIRGVFAPFRFRGTHAGGSSIIGNLFYISKTKYIHINFRNR